MDEKGFYYKINWIEKASSFCDAITFLLIFSTMIVKEL